MNRHLSHSDKPTMAGTSTRSISTDSTGTNRSSNSAGSIPSPPSRELCALMGFAYKLGSIVRNNDPSFMLSNNDVLREAKLLMSLSCSSPIPTDESSNSISSSNNNHNHNNEVSSIASSSGRITPTHSVTSTSSSTSISSSRRSTFCFTCPSLSLEGDHTRKGNTTDNNSSSSTGTISTPGTMLSRTLKLDDKDALRLSSEAMGRNITESFEKAMGWRIQSWVDSLSTVLVIKERELESVTPDDDAQGLLYYSNEALLVAALRESEGKVQVREATTSFKVMNKVSSVDNRGAPLKKQRMGAENEERNLEEGEYVYNVIHFLEMQCSLKISSPAGHVQIELNVPGKIKGTFTSCYDSVDKLTDVTIHLNTEMLASMIEKSSRIAVRASVEALLKGEHVVASAADIGCGGDVKVVKNFTTIDHSLKKKMAVTKKKNHTSASPTREFSAPSTLYQTRTPKRNATKSDVSGLVIITPASGSSSAPPFYDNSDSDADNFKPQSCQLKLQIPDNFPVSSIESKKDSNNFEANFFQTQVAKQQTDGNLLAARLPSKKFLPQKRAVITPQKKATPVFVRREKGPTLPMLVEVASEKGENK